VVVVACCRLGLAGRMAWCWTSLPSTTEAGPSLAARRLPAAVVAATASRAAPPGGGGSCSRGMFNLLHDCTSIVLVHRGEAADWSDASQIARSSDRHAFGRHKGCSRPTTLSLQPQAKGDCDSINAAPANRAHEAGARLQATGRLHTDPAHQQDRQAAPGNLLAQARSAAQHSRHARASRSHGVQCGCRPPARRQQLQQPMWRPCWLCLALRSSTS
jgi:hypothetical protein